MTTQARTTKEKLQASGDELVDKVKELIHEGSVRRVIVKDPEGRTVIEVPAAIGVVGLLAAPTMTAIGALAAVTADYSIEVERQSV